MPETKQARVYPADLPRLEAARKRLTVLREGETQTTADVIAWMLDVIERHPEIAKSELAKVD